MLEYLMDLLERVIIEATDISNMVLYGSYSTEAIEEAQAYLKSLKEGKSVK